MNIGPLVSIKWKERSISICEKTEICHFVHILIILIHNIIIIIIILFHWPTAFVLHFSSKKNYTALLTESFRMSMTYLKTRTRQIANQPPPQYFLKFSFAIHYTVVLYTKEAV